MQDDISRAMVGALSSELLGDSSEPIVSRSTDDPEAYRLYLQGNRWFDLSEGGLRRNVAYLEQALAIAPAFPQARAALSTNLMLLSALGVERPADTMERAREEALAALQLDETLAEAHIALAAVLDGYDWDFAAAERVSRRAIELNPANPFAHERLGTLLPQQGRAREGIEELRLSLGLDPLSARSNLLLCYALNYSGDFEAAIVQANRARAGISRIWRSSLGALVPRSATAKRRASRHRGGSSPRVTPSLSRGARNGAGSCRPRG